MIKPISKESMDLIVSTTKMLCEANKVKNPTKSQVSLVVKSIQLIKSAEEIISDSAKKRIQ